MGGLFDEFFDQATGEEGIPADVGGREEAHIMAAEPGVGRGDAPVEDVSTGDDLDLPAADSSADEGGAPEAEGEAPGFTSLHPEDLSPEGQRLMAQLQADYQAKVSDISKLKVDYEKTQQYGAFLEAVQNDPALRDHIVTYFQQRNQGPVQPDSEPLMDRRDYPDSSDEEFQALENVAQKFLGVVERKYGRVLQESQSAAQKINGLTEQLEAQREMSALDKQYPGWENHVDPGVLLKAKEAEPGRSVVSLYRELDYDKAGARAKREVFQKGPRKQRAVTAPGAGRSKEPDRLEGVTDFESAVDAAIAEMGYRI